MRGPCILLALGALITACDTQDPAPAPEPTPTETATVDPQEQASIMRPELEVERPPIALEPLRVTIPFSDGGAELDEAALDELAALIETDQWDQVERVILRGHSDAGGPSAINLRLSEERAQAVADWMIERGLDEDAVRIIAFGSQNPVQPNLLPSGEPNERGRAANRRVEVTILVPEGATIPDPGPTPPAATSGPPATDGAAKSAPSDSSITQ